MRQVRLRRLLIGCDAGPIARQIFWVAACGRPALSFELDAKPGEPRRLTTLARHRRQRHR